MLLQGVNKLLGEYLQPSTYCGGIWNHKHISNFIVLHVGGTGQRLSLRSPNPVYTL